MRTLLIAPDSDLEFGRREVDRVVSSLKPTLLSGDVTISRLMEVAGPHDCIWLIAHGTDKGIQLSDHRMTLGVLGTLVRAQNTKLLVMNTCESASLAIAIHETISIDVIATIAEVNDAQAFTIGATFASQLASGLSVKDAYFVSKPIHNQDYLYLPASAAAQVKRYMQHSNEGSRQADRLDERLRSIEDYLREMRWRFEGNPSLGIKGIPEHMQEIDDRLSRVEKQVERATTVLELHSEILEAYGNNRMGSAGWIAVSTFVGVMATAGIITIWTTLF